MDPALIDRLLALPALRKQAEEDAREYHTSYEHTLGIRLLTWKEFSDVQRQDRTDAMARLLADPSRKQSQGWMLDEIARLLGWAKSPVFPNIFMDADGWLVECDGEQRSFTRSGRFGAHIPDLPTDRPAAIAAILLHLSGAA